MSETAILSMFFKDRDSFERFSGAIPSHLLENETSIMLADLAEWYKLNPDDSRVDLRSFWEWFKLVRHPSYQHDQLTNYHIQLNTIKDFPKHDKTANEIVKTLILREAAAKIATMADAYAAGESKDFFNNLPDLWETAAKEANVLDDDEYEVKTTLVEIGEKLDNREAGLSWRCNMFNTAAGPIRPGNLICLAAYVDSGKTSLAASEVTYMAKQLPEGKRVLWLNNEQAGDEVKLRICQAALGMSIDEIRDVGWGNAWQKYQDYMQDDEKIVLIDTARITPALVRRKLRQHDIGLAVFDQLHKLQGKFNVVGDAKVDRMSAAFQYGRELAKEHHMPVIAIHQARGASALEQTQIKDNQNWFLEMSELAGSRDAIQAECDLIITMGRNPKDEHPGRRYMNFAKNKLPTPASPDKRNLRADLIFDMERSRF